MFNAVFWILAIWFVINVIWMWFVLSDQQKQKTFAWINVAAVVIGFWVFYGINHTPSTLATCFLTLNWINVILAALQFYYGYRHTK